MPDLVAIAADVDAAVASLRGAGAILSAGLVLSALALAFTGAYPPARARLRTILAAHTALLVVGEALLLWFHWRLWHAAVVIDPLAGGVTGRIAVSPWVESEKLYVWALALAVMAIAARRHRDELAPGLAVAVAALTLGAILWGQPFTDPLPDYLGQYRGYLQALGSGSTELAVAAWQGIEGARRFYYNTWYMWVHPPLLFVSYGAFVASFVATVLTIRHRRSSFERTAYGWARLGYLPLTLGMLLGFPWAIMAWQGDAWWWSGKVNMSIMMWLLYTAYLHGRLYLRRRGMWKVAVGLAALSFLTLVLTYLTTYVVPGAHSVA